MTVKNLSAWYDSGKMTLSDFSLELMGREVAGLIGLNGAGKTTFLKVLSGLLPTFCCENVCFCGHPVKFREPDFKLHRYTVFAEDNSFQYFTFREYFSYVFSVYKKELPDIAELELIHGFHFEDYVDILLKNLSTGNRKKAFLITAFALKPRLLSSLCRARFYPFCWNWFYPVRNWQIESDLWRHPRKYIVPVILLLLAGAVGIFPALMPILIILLVVEVAVLLFLICKRF